jgi:hypothetical protein
MLWPQRLLCLWRKIPNMTDANSRPIEDDSAPLDPNFQADLERLHQLMVWWRWAVVLGLWLTIGALSLWQMREPLWLMSQYFTWAALHYAFRFNRWSALGIMICLVMTLSVLLWQSRNILFGRSVSDQERLHQQLLRIKQQGESHPLWRWMYGKKKVV